MSKLCCFCHQAESTECKLSSTGVIVMQYLSLTFQECMQSLPQKMVRNKITAYTHTAFLKIFRVVQEKKDKSA